LIILRQVAQSLIYHAETFNSQDLSNSMWTLATLGFGLNPGKDDSMTKYVILKSQQPGQDAQFMLEAVDVVMRVTQTSNAQFGSQALCNVSWSFARLMGRNNNNNNNSNNNDRPMSAQFTQWFRAIGMQLANQKRPVTSQGIGIHCGVCLPWDFEMTSSIATWPSGLCPTKRMAIHHKPCPMRYGPSQQLK
jgi:hypothetical protein